MWVVIHNNPLTCTGFRYLGKKGKEIPFLEIGKVCFSYQHHLCLSMSNLLFSGYLTCCISFRHFLCLDLLIFNYTFPRPFSLFNVNILYGRTPVLTPLSTPSTIPFLPLSVKILIIMCIVETYSLINGDLIIVYI